MSAEGNRSSDDQVAAKLAQLHTRCICRTDIVSWADISALLTCAEALRPFANYACDEPCDCHNCQARSALTKLEAL